MQRSLSFLVKSGMCTALFRARGIESSVVGCEGLIPKLHTAGEVRIGAMFGVRGRILPPELGAARKDAYLHIGDRVVVNQGASVVAHYGIEIGDDTLVGEFSAIYDTNHHSVQAGEAVKSAPVIIGRDVWLARGVLVLPGSRIGDSTVVATGSVVRGDLPPRVLAAGNPAKPVKELDIRDGWRRR